MFSWSLSEIMNFFQSDDDIIEAVHTAVKTGYRHLDCAAIYRNERAVGSAIKQLIVEGTITREDLFVSSKVHNVVISKPPDKALFFDQKLLIFFLFLNENIYCGTH